MKDLRELKAACQSLNEGGIAPGAIAQAVLEECHGMELMPFGSRSDCRVTTVDESTGRIEQKRMGPDADYVVTTGPDYEVAHTSVYPGTGTTILTIKRVE